MECLGCHFLNMVIEEKLLPIYDHTHSHLSHGIWMDERKICPLKGRGFTCWKKSLKTCCLMKANTSTPYECSTCIGRMSQTWPLLEFDENEFWLIFYVKQFVVYTTSLDLSKIFLENKVIKLIAMGNLIFF